MNWRKIKPLILTFVAAFLLILVTEATVAEEGDIQIVKMGTNVIVPAGEVMTDAVTIGGDVTVLNHGEVTNNAVAIGGDIVLMNDARIRGDALAIGGEIVKEENAVISGSEITLFSNPEVLLDRFGLFGTLYLTNALFSLIYLLLIFSCGTFLLLLLCDRLESITATMHQHSFKSGMCGLGGVVATMLFTALFAGSVFGLLMIPVVNLAFVIAGLLGAIATGLWIGKKVLPRKQKAFIPFLVGTMVLAIIGLIPLAGGLIILMLDLFGFGAVLLSHVGTIQPETIQK